MKLARMFAASLCRDDRSDSHSPRDKGTFLVGGAPDGRGAGILILDQKYIFDEVKIVSLTATKLTLNVDPANGDNKLIAVKQ